MEKIELNCKMKGKYHNVNLKNYKEFVTKVTKEYPAFEKSIVSCLDNPKNVIKEYIKFAHGGVEIDDKIKQHWYKSLLLTILKSAKEGLSFAYNLIRLMGRYIRKAITKNAVDTVTANIVVVGFSLALGGIVAGITSAVIMIGLSIWLHKVERKMYSIKVSDEKSWKNKIKKWKKAIINKIKGKEDEDIEIPEELKAPEPEVPNISVSMFKENHMFKETTGLELFGGVIFVLFLKAVIAYRFNEEMREKIKYLSALYSPIGLILALSSVLMMVGSGGASAVLA